MKNYLIYSLLLLPFSIIGQTELDQSYQKEGIKHLIISNFNGSMDVEPSPDNQIHIKVVKERGEITDEYFIDQLQKNDFLAVYYRVPCMKDHAQLNFNPDSPMNFFSFNSKDSDTGCQHTGDPFQDFAKFKFEIKVPQGVNVYVSTINDGDIEIRDIDNPLHADNINGNISMTNVKNVKSAKTINGDVRVVFKDYPSRSGVYSTINGDIEIEVDKDSDLQANFKSFQGDLYTDFENAAVLESKPQQKKTNKFKLNINEYTSIQIGIGGVDLNLETFNGNAYIKSK